MNQKQLSDFDHLWGDEPPIIELSDFLVYLDSLMWADDVEAMNIVLNKPTKETNKLMMVAVLRGLYAYRRHNLLPEWEKAVARTRDWLIERGEKTESLLVGLIDRGTLEVSEVKIVL
jgi:hypothetical protein